MSSNVPAEIHMKPIDQERTAGKPIATRNCGSAVKNASITAGNDVNQFKKT